VSVHTESFDELITDAIQKYVTVSPYKLAKPWRRASSFTGRPVSLSCKTCTGISTLPVRGERVKPNFPLMPMSGRSIPPNAPGDRLRVTRKGQLQVTWSSSIEINPPQGGIKEIN
jgi:hypothetical protein